MDTRAIIARLRERSAIQNGCMQRVVADTKEERDGMVQYIKGTERNGTERNGTERNRTERNGTEKARDDPCILRGH